MALKQFFFGKLSDLKKKKKKKKTKKNPYIPSRDVRLHNLGPNLARIANFPKREFFGTIKCYIYLPIVPHYAHIMHVLYRISQILTEWIKNLGQLVTFAYFLCPIMPLNITKKITRVDHDIEGCKNLGKTHLF